MSILDHKPGNSSQDDYKSVISYMTDSLIARVVNGGNPITLADEFVKIAGEELRSAFYDYYYYINTTSWRLWIKKFKFMMSTQYFK